MRPDDERYFAAIESRLDEAMAVAEAARSQGRDPRTEVEIPVAADMADRVEKVLGIEGVADRVRELEGELSREEAALALAEDFAAGRVGDYDTRAGRVEGAVRTAVALLTEGVVAAPIEGIDRVELLENDDGTEFVNVYYAGPIRSAGGTAQALSVLVADYARALLDLDEYRARDAEVERYAEEVTLYDEDTGLQYSPSDDETRHIAEHMPVMLDGEATGDEEVSGFRDLERVDTNNPRGGMCLVLAEGIALKAPKIQRYTRDLDEIDWPWLQDLIDGTVGSEGADDGDESEAESGDESEAAAAPAAGGPPRPAPSKKYLRDLIAGRPVFGHPSEPGGFRLRYGRARNHGFATAGVHPATMHLVDDFLATGTQIKTERPGKAAGVVPVDSIEGPTVRLANGEVRRIDDPAEAIEVRNGVEAVLDLGEYLVNYGEFVENNHPLAPAAYAYEWWVQEFAATDADVEALRDDPHVDLRDPPAGRAIRWAVEHDAPLHPVHTHLWHDVSVAEFEALAAAAADGSLVAADPDGGRAIGRGDGPTGASGGDGDGGDDGDGGEVLLLADDPDVRRTLERLLVEHRRTDEGVVVPDPMPLVRSLGLTPDLDMPWGPSDVPDAAREYADGANAVRAVNAVAPFAVRERAPTRIGNRMGRPEKSESRDLSPAVHALFPVGPAGGPQRDVGAAATAAGAPGDGPLDLDLGRRECPDCGREGYRLRCPDCGAHTEPRYECDDCGRIVDPDESGRVVCPRCDREVTSVDEWAVPLDDHYRAALEAVGERENAFEILKGVKGLSSANKTPEPLAKGVLRAKHGVTAFKDGTVRYDMTDLPVTAVRPAELDVTADQLRALGYETDVDGEPLRFDDQLVELRVQDVVLSEGAADHLLATADFVDDLLSEFYGLDPFYEVDERDDLVGELVFGMAPHTSAAVVGRVVGFTSAAVGYAHPYFHAAKRRNCFHPDTKVWYENGDGEWRHERIEALVERHVDPDAAETDDLGTLVDDSVAGLRVPSLDATGDQSPRSVEAVSKHPSPDHLVRVTTRSGRELMLTPDHEVHVRDPDTDRLVGCEARALAEDDSLVLPGHLDTVDPVPDSERIDLLAAFAESDAIPDDRLMVNGLNKDRLYDLFESILADEVDHFHPLTSTAEHLGLRKKTLSNYLYRGSIPVALLDELFESRDDLLRFVPDDATLGIKRDRTGIDRFVELNERVATLLGYYAAEGVARERETTQGTIQQTTICGTETEVGEFVLDTFREDLGVEPCEESDAKISVSGRLPRVLFDTVLDAGTGARTKRVPGPVFDASDEVVAAYLRGYFSGDGAVEPGDTVVSATTVSPELREDLLALLTRLGIKARVRETDPVPLETTFPDDYADGGPTSAPGYRLRISSTDAVRFHERVGFHLPRKTDQLAADVEATEVRGRRVFDGGSEDYLLDEIAETEIVASDVDHVYCLTVEGTHSLIANDVSAKQCDGDEDCVMLLLDGLLNFSTEYLPDARGGSMDAPLVMSSRIDPTEIDDEAHNVDVVERYSRAFYEATREMADPDEVDVRTAADSLDTADQYRGFAHTHDTGDIALGPDLSAYKTLGSMTEKTDAQLELARKLRAVDEGDVAERIIEYHFLPDLIGNLRAFTSQETRCLDCGTSYRRMPLTRDCRECGGDMTLTVHEGSVSKYLDTALRVAREYDCREYTKQRLEIIDRSIERVFEDDTNKQSGIADFM